MEQGMQGLGERRTVKGCVNAVLVLGGKKKPKAAKKPRAKETQPRDMAEKRLERDIIWNLQLMGCEVAKSGETSVYNSRHILAGMSDLLVFIPGGGVVFMEVKVQGRGLRDSQVRFKELCERCGLEYRLVYSVKEARGVVDEKKEKEIDT